MSSRAVSVPSRGRLAPYRCRTVAVLHRIAAASWPHRVRPRTVPLRHVTVTVPCCGRNAPYRCRVKPAWAWSPFGFGPILQAIGVYRIPQKRHSKIFDSEIVW